MIFSKTSEYAIRALGFMARRGNGRALGAGEVGKKTGVPAAYVAKIFQGLAQAGVLDSERGPKGGYRFRRAPSSLSLLDVVKVTDDFPGSSLSGCVMGFKNCSHQHPCALHPAWARSRENMIRAMRATSVLQASKLKSRKAFGRKRRGMLTASLRAVLKPA